MPRIIAIDPDSNLPLRFGTLEAYIFSEWESTGNARGRNQDRGAPCASCGGILERLEAALIAPLPIPAATRCSRWRRPGAVGSGRGSGVPSGSLLGTPWLLSGSRP